MALEVLDEFHSLAVFLLPELEVAVLTGGHDEVGGRGEDVRDHVPVHERLLVLLGRRNCPQVRVLELQI